MKKIKERQWMCGCGETNTVNICKKCGQEKNDRKDFVVCDNCKEIYFSENHTCKK